MCKYDPACSTIDHSFGEVTEIMMKAVCINCGQEKRSRLYMVVCTGERQEEDKLWHVFTIITPVIHCPKCRGVQLELMLLCPTTAG